MRAGSAAATLRCGRRKVRQIIRQGRKRRRKPRAEALDLRCQNRPSNRSKPQKVSAPERIRTSDLRFRRPRPEDSFGASKPNLAHKGAKNAPENRNRGQRGASGREVKR